MRLDENKRALEVFGEMEVVTEEPVNEPMRKARLRVAELTLETILEAFEKGTFSWEVPLDRELYNNAVRKINNLKDQCPHEDLLWTDLGPQCTSCKTLR